MDLRDVKDVMEEEKEAELEEEKEEDEDLAPQSLVRRDSSHPFILFLQLLCIGLASFFQLF